jgi:DNA replication protein DnaC
MRIPGFRTKLTTEHYEGMKIPSKFRGSVFAMIDREPLTTVCSKYLTSLDSMLDDGAGLLLWGANGTGKTTAAVVVAKEARCRGASVLFTTVESLRQHVLDKAKFDDDLLFGDRAESVDLLILDDLGKEHDSEWSQRMLENLVRVRASFKRSTIITTNTALTELVKVYRVSFMEILKEACVPVQVEGESHRDEIGHALRAKLATG